MTKQRCAAVAVILVAATTAGCSLAMMAPIVVKGQAFPVEQATRLRAGMSENEVTALIGPPLRRASGAPVVWRYEFTRRLKECRFYVGPIPFEPVRTERHALELTFGDVGLERAIHTEAAPGRATERVLVRAR